MMSAALLPADHADRAVNALVALREVLTKRKAQADLAAHQCNVEHDFYWFEKAFGAACAYSAAIDDITLAIHKERHGANWPLIPVGSSITKEFGR